MVGWQTTVTTVYCDAVDDEVTIVVYEDWSVSVLAMKSMVKAVGIKLIY